VAAPHGLAGHRDGSRGKRYAARTGTWRMPASAARKDEGALACGRDGRALLTAGYAAAGSDPDLAFLARLHPAGVLRVVLVRNYLTAAGERGREVTRRREAKVEGLPPGRSRITSGLPGAEVDGKGHLPARPCQQLPEPRPSSAAPTPS
jgi:hypothetical protein